MFAILQAHYGLVTPIDLTTATLAFAMSYSTGTTHDHVAAHLRTHRMAVATASPFSEHFMVLQLRMSVAAVPAFATTLDFFGMTYPTIAQQTFANLATALKTAQNTSSGTAATLGHAHATAQATAQATATHTQQPNAHARSNTPNRFCWTHGTCFHDGAHCRSKAVGHIDDATSRKK